MIKVGYNKPGLLQCGLRFPTPQLTLMTKNVAMQSAKES